MPCIVHIIGVNMCDHPCMVGTKNNDRRKVGIIQIGGIDEFMHPGIINEDNFSDQGFCELLCRI